MESRLPPLDGARGAQVPLIYEGPHLGNFSMRHRETQNSYRFSASPSNCIRWILLEEAEWFALQQDFRVLWDSKVDPAEDAKRALMDRLEKLELASTRPTPVAPERVKLSESRGGRPRTPGEQNLYLWHLKAHCGWRLKQISVGGKVDSSVSPEALSKRLQRFRKDGAPPSESACAFCQRGEYEVPPE